MDDNYTVEISIYQFDKNNDMLMSEYNKFYDKLKTIIHKKNLGYAKIHIDIVEDTSFDTVLSMDVNLTPIRIILYQMNKAQRNMKKIDDDIIFTALINV